MLRKFPNLLKEINTNKDEMIFVENPNEYNNKVIDELRSRVDVMITGRTVNKKLPFHTVVVDEIEEIGSFVIINRKRLDSLIDKKDIFKKIIADYQKREK